VAALKLPDALPSSRGGKVVFIFNFFDELRRESRP
jgi:hypothetical protein